MGRVGDRVRVPVVAGSRLPVSGALVLPRPRQPRRAVLLLDASSSANARTHFEHADGSREEISVLEAERPALEHLLERLEDTPRGVEREIYVLTDGDLPYSGRFVDCRRARRRGGQDAEQACKSHRNPTRCPVAMRYVVGRSDLAQVDVFAAHAGRELRVESERGTAALSRFRIHAAAEFPERFLTNLRRRDRDLELRLDDLLAEARGRRLEIRPEGAGD